MPFYENAFLPIYFYIVTIIIMLEIIGDSIIDTFVGLRDISKKDLNVFGKYQHLNYKYG